MQVGSDPRHKGRAGFRGRQGELAVIGGDEAPLQEAIGGGDVGDRRVEQFLG